MADVSIRNDLSNAPINEANPFSGRLVPLRTDTSVVHSVRQYQRAQSGTADFRFPLDTPKYYMRLEIADYARSNLMRVNFNSKSRIILPLPQGIADTHEVDFQEEELGQFGGAAVNQAMNTWVNKNIEASTNFRDLGMQLGLNVLGGATNTNAAGLAQAVMGFAPNKFLTVLLKGPKYKRHEFIWKLAPRTFEESEAIRQITKTMNNAMAPALTAGGVIFTFPEIFKISYMPNSKFLFKFKPAVLESFTVNYTPGGVPAFFHHKQNPDATDGDFPPESVELRARFLELEYWLKGDYNDLNETENSQFF